MGGLSAGVGWPDEDSRQRVYEDTSPHDGLVGDGRARLRGHAEKAGSEGRQARAVETDKQSGSRSRGEEEIINRGDD